MPTYIEQLDKAYSEARNVCEMYCIGGVPVTKEQFDTLETYIKNQIVAGVGEKTFSHIEADDKIEVNFNENVLTIPECAIAAAAKLIIEYREKHAGEHIDIVLNAPLEADTDLLSNIKDIVAAELKGVNINLLYN